MLTSHLSFSLVCQAAPIITTAHLNGNLCSTEVEWMLSQHILQPQKINICTQCHLAHAVSVEVKLVLNNFSKMLQIKQIYSAFAACTTAL